MKVSDESTIVMNDGAPTKTPVSAPVKKTNKKGSFWQGVLVGGIPGILLGSAGTVFAAQAPVHNEEGAEEVNDEVVEPVVEETTTSSEENNTTAEGANIPEIGETVEVASNVNDDMSFSKLLHQHAQKLVQEEFLCGMAMYIAHITKKNGTI